MFIGVKNFLGKDRLVNLDKVIEIVPSDRADNDSNAMIFFDDRTNLETMHSFREFKDHFIALQNKEGCKCSKD